MRVQVTKRGMVRPLKELLFWSERRQAMERAGDEDLAAGRYETFDDVEDFLSALDVQAQSASDRRPDERP